MCCTIKKGGDLNPQPPRVIEKKEEKTKTRTGTYKCIVQLKNKNTDGVHCGEGLQVYKFIVQLKRQQQKTNAGKGGGLLRCHIYKCIVQLKTGGGGGGAEKC